jgi:DNA-binding CsgD family transcriptional regulator
VAAELDEEIYKELEQAVYEAAVIPELWPQVLERLGTVTGTAGGAFATMNERGVSIVCAPVMDEARRKIIEQGYMSRSGRAQGVIAKGLVGVPRFLNEYDYYDGPEDAEKDPIVTEVFRQSGLGWAAGWLIQLPHGDTLVMNVEQYYERGPIVGDTLAQLDSLYPVFARGATLAARIDLAQVRTAIETLSAVGLPAAALSASRRVVLANDAFAAAAHAWTTRGGDRLALADRVADAMLAEAIARIDLAGSPRSIPVRGTPGGPVAGVIHVIPVRRAAHDVFGNTAAIVVLSEPTRQVADAALVHSLFDLTPAEIAVAQSVAAGLSPAQIARTTGRSIATIRNQLKSAMQKTGSGRQVELALLIRQLGTAGS